MLTALEKRDINIYGDKALDAVDDMRKLIDDFESPANNMTWGEFSLFMHRYLIKYEDSANKIEAIYMKDFKRVFCDDEEDE